MNPDVVEIYDISFNPDGRCDVEAVVEDSIVVLPQTDYDPAQWGPAVCRGSFYLCEDDVIPATDAGLRRLVSERVNNWEMVDCTDWADDC
jgi:hypothetical protein